MLKLGFPRLVLVKNVVCVPFDFGGSEPWVSTFQVGLLDLHAAGDAGFFSVCDGLGHESPRLRTDHPSRRKEGG